MTTNELGRAIAERRKALGLRRSQLSARMGYRNISRGSGKIAGWEKGQWDELLGHPNGLAGGRAERCHKALIKRPQLDRLTAALEWPGDALDAPFEAVMASVGAQEARARDMAEFADRARSSSLRAMTAGLPLLRHRVDEIFARSEWAETPFEPGIIGLSYLGWSALTVGDLLRGWNDGNLVAPCAQCGGELLIYTALGSTLSGCVEAQGFCCSGGSSQRAQLNREARRRIARARGRRGRRPGTSSPSFHGLLQVLGAEQPQMNVVDRRFRPLARFDHGRSQLTFSGGAGRPGADCPLASAEAHTPWEITREGASWVFKAHGATWTYREGYLVDGDGIIRALFDQPPAADVALACVKHIIQHASKGEDHDRSEA